MLVLSRREGEAVVIPDLDITIRLIEIRRDHVRIGIEAPRHIAVHRDEVWERIERSQSLDELAPAPCYSV